MKFAPCSGVAHGAVVVVVIGGWVGGLVVCYSMDEMCCP